MLDAERGHARRASSTRDEVASAGHPAPPAQPRRRRRGRRRLGRAAAEPHNILVDAVTRRGRDRRRAGADAGCGPRVGRLAVLRQERAAVPLDARQGLPVVAGRARATRSANAVAGSITTTRATQVRARRAGPPRTTWPSSAASSSRRSTTALVEHLPRDRRRPQATARGPWSSPSGSRPCDWLAAALPKDLEPGRRPGRGAARRAQRRRAAGASSSRSSWSPHRSGCSSPATSPPRASTCTRSATTWSTTTSRGA